MSKKKLASVIPNMKQINVVCFGDEFSLPIMIDIITSIATLNISHVVTSSFLNDNFLTLQNRIPACHFITIDSKDDWIKLESIIKSNSIGICFSFSRKIPSKVLNSFHYGAINFHGGKLPDFAGPNALNWTLIMGQKELYLTAHVMTERFDEGGILDEVSIDIDFTDDALTLRTKLGLEAKKLLPNVIERLVSNPEVLKESQVRQVRKYLQKRNPSDGQINWKMSDIEIYNLIRALVSPWPGAFYISPSGEKIVINERVEIEEIQFLRRLNDV